MFIHSLQPEGTIGGCDEKGNHGDVFGVTLLPHFQAKGDAAEEESDGGNRRHPRNRPFQSLRLDQMILHD